MHARPTRSRPKTTSPPTSSTSCHYGTPGSGKEGLYPGLAARGRGAGHARGARAAARTGTAGCRRPDHRRDHPRAGGESDRAVASRPRRAVRPLRPGHRHQFQPRVPPRGRRAEDLARRTGWAPTRPPTSAARPRARAHRMARLAANERNGRTQEDAAGHGDRRRHRARPALRQRGRAARVHGHAAGGARASRWPRCSARTPCCWRRESGGEPFDEACSRLWWELAAHFGDRRSRSRWPASASRSNCAARWTCATTGRTGCASALCNTWRARAWSTCRASRCPRRCAHRRRWKAWSRCTRRKRACWSS